MEVELAAQLGKTKLTVAELVSLQKGDVIRLDRYKDEEIDVLLGKNPKFKAQVGKNRGKRAIKIADVIQTEFDLENTQEDFNSFLKGGRSE